jgi:hypothetical protein
MTGAANEMAIDFVAFGSAAQAVTFVPAAGGTASVTNADCRLQTLNFYTAFFCTAKMAPLVPATVYNYTVGVTGAMSASFSFSNGVYANGRDTPRFGVYADFGYGNDESLQFLIKDAQAGGFVSGRQRRCVPDAPPHATPPHSHPAGCVSRQRPP